MKNKRIVITGVGVVSSIGIGKDEFWKKLLAGKSSFSQISLFDTKKYKIKIAGEVKNFNAADYLGQKGLRDFDRTTKFLCTAAKFALEDSGLFEKTNKARIGISVGSALGSTKSYIGLDLDLIRNGPRLINPSAFPNMVANAAASRLAIKFNITGINSTVSNGSCSFSDALEFAVCAINNNHAEQVIVGAAEELSEEIFAGFYAAKCLAGMKPKAPLVSCPFDKRRNGGILSEGAGVIIIEEMNAALKRKAKIYAEVVGINSLFCAYKPMSYDPAGKGMSGVMQGVLDKINLNREDIDVIFANANSTLIADLAETKAIKAVFKQRIKTLPITAIKSIIGETHSASGVMNLLAAIGALTHNVIPPTINQQEKDTQCDLDYVANIARPARLNKIMLNSFDLNGAHSVALISKVKGTKQ